MDVNQSNHLKAYGLTFWVLENNTNVDWILNYRGGSFMVDSSERILEECIIRGVTYETINSIQKPFKYFVSISWIFWRDKHYFLYK